MVPTFTETSSPELDATLSTLREQYFIPAYLSNRQRNLIYKDKYKIELENNPAFASLGDEEIPLKHVDRRTEIEARKPLVRKAFELMREPMDWQQLPMLLEGLAKTGHSPSVGQQAKLIRHAILSDHLQVIVNCLQKQDRKSVV